MNTRRTIILLLALLLILSFPGLVSAQQDPARVYFHLFGGMNRIFEYGCDCDYELSVNDFPLTPAHTTAAMGAGFGYLLGRGFGLELDARYYGSTEVTLTDPSDDDTVKINSAKHYSVTFNLLYQILSGSVRPYLLGGAGIDSLVDAGTEFYETDMGYEFELAAPDKSTHFLWNLGGGVEFVLGRTVGLRLDARYVNIPESGNQPTIQSMNATAGVTVRF
ncbi:MAG: outer membrane beta-barrel protein [Candidatus Aminicenantaceae bacterium]